MLCRVSFFHISPWIIRDSLTACSIIWTHEWHPPSLVYHQLSFTSLRHKNYKRIFLYLFSIHNSLISRFAMKRNKTSTICPDSLQEIIRCNSEMEFNENKHAHNKCGKDNITVTNTPTSARSLMPKAFIFLWQDKLWLSAVLWKTLLSLSSCYGIAISIRKKKHILRIWSVQYQTLNERK